MSRFLLAAMLAIAMIPAISFAQAPAKDSAHTLFTPNAPDPGRSGAVVQLPQGDVGVTTGGTANYQTLGTPNGSATMVPSGGTSAMFSSEGRTGAVATPR
jgi:hypothetical protein